MKLVARQNILFRCHITVSFYFYQRMIKEKETAEGADPPRVMALDDYFESDGQVTDHILCMKRGDIGLFITLVPKVT